MTTVDDAPGRRSALDMGAVIASFFRKYWYAYAMIAPVAIVVGLIVLVPLVENVFFSFTDINAGNIGNPILDRQASYDVVGVRNYEHVLSGDPYYGSFWATLVRTVVWTFGSVACHLTIGLGLAMMLNRKVRLRGLYRVLLIVPWAVPAFISAFAWRYLFNSTYGIFNELLRAVGLPAPVWLGQSNLAMFSVIVVNVWLGVPFMMMALLGGLQSIPHDLYEAAEIDGASPWQRFVNVTLPGLRAVSSTVVLLGVIWTFNMFAVIYLVAGTGNPNTQILITYAFQMFFSGNIRNYAIAATYGVLIMSLLLVFTVFYRTLLRRHEEVL